MTDKNRAVASSGIVQATNYANLLLDDLSGMSQQGSKAMHHALRAMVEMHPALVAYHLTRSIRLFGVEIVTENQPSLNASDHPTAS